MLLDLALSDSRWAQRSAAAIAAAADAGPLVINPLIFAEVSVGYERVEDLDEVLPVTDFRREPLPYRAGFLAGKAYVRYRQAGGTKRSPLPDLYIGAHAAVADYRLLTRDAARYRTYFPRLTLVAPDLTSGQNENARRFMCYNP